MARPGGGTSENRLGQAFLQRSHKCRRLSGPCGFCAAPALPRQRGPRCSTDKAAGRRGFTRPVPCWPPASDQPSGVTGTDTHVSWFPPGLAPPYLGTLNSQAPPWSASWAEAESRLNQDVCWQWPCCPKGTTYKAAWERPLALSFEVRTSEPKPLITSSVNLRLSSALNVL